MVHDTLLPHDASRHQIFVREGGGSGPFGIKRIKKSSDNVVFSLVLNLFYRSVMVTFKENYHFPRFHGSRGVQHLPGGDPTFSRGGGVSNC